MIANSDRETYAGIVEGSILRLKRPLGALTSLRLMHDRFDGQEVDLFGHVVGNTLAGASHVGIGEPAYVAGEFRNFAEQRLQILSLGTRLAGAPETILVLDPAQGLAFVGIMMPQPPPDVVPFHGFYRTIATREATAFDRKSFHDGARICLGRHIDEDIVEAWYYDARNNRIYATITAFGETDVLEVLDLPHVLRLAA